MKCPFEQHYTPSELAKVLRVHPCTIRRRFLDEPGVLRLGSPGHAGRKQRLVLRIPRSVAERVYRQLASACPESRGLSRPEKPTRRGTETTRRGLGAPERLLEDVGTVTSTGGPEVTRVEPMKANEPGVDLIARLSPNANRSLGYHGREMDACGEGNR